MEFQRKVLEIKIKTENKISKDKLVFFDRGIPDSIAYYFLYGLNDEELTKFCRKRTYRKIFLLN